MDAVLAFIEKFQLPFMETSMSKGVLDEAHPLFVGHYPGMGTSDETRQFVVESDSILWFGPYLVSNRFEASSTNRWIYSDIVLE